MTTNPLGTFAGADDVDLRLASRELDAARAMLREAHAIESRWDRCEAIKAAVSKLALASRAIDVVVDRRSP
ncbi:MAG: hypothetical protein ABI467_28865 [Kofleriaceae bacterium]